MSDAQLLAGFEACVRRLIEERNRSDYIPLNVAICRPEGRGGGIFQDGLFVPLLGHADYIPRLTCSTVPPDSYVVAFSIPRDRGFIGADRVNVLIRQTAAIVEELEALCERLTARVQQALCLSGIRGWWRTLFHLAWHFDRPFLSSHRDRLLTSDNHPTIRVDETCIQESGCGGQRDVLPGLIFGTLRHDASAATEAAVGVLLDAIRGDLPPAPGPTSGDVGRMFAQLREQFLRTAEFEDNLPGPDTTVKLLRFSDSFTTPPATEWADLQLGGQVESMWRLARINADQEFCQVRGPATQQINEWAAEAGNALPAGIPDGPTLFDEDRLLPNGVLARFSGPTPILSPGPVQRWLRFVFSTLNRLRPDELQIRWGTPVGATSYGLATLKQNIFAASALAIELANLLPAEPGWTVFTHTHRPDGPSDSSVVATPEDQGENGSATTPSTSRQLTATDRVRVNLHLERVLAFVPEPIPCGPDSATRTSEWCENLRVPAGDIHAVTHAWREEFAHLAGHIEAACGGWQELPTGTDDMSCLAVELLNRSFRVSAAFWVFRRHRLSGTVPQAEREEAARWNTEDGLWVAEQLLNLLYATSEDFERFKAAIRNVVGRVLTASSPLEDRRGVRHVSLAEFQSALQQQLHHGMATLDTIQVGVEPGQVVQVTGLSCKVVRGSTPTACPDANPVLPPSLLDAAERAIRQLCPLPPGTTIHWVGHETGVRSRCRCVEYRDAPFAAPFDQPRWAPVSEPTPPLSLAREVPAWEETARRLLFRGQVCKHFKKPAPDQETVITAFQEEGWPDAIDDPLQPGKLARTVESLNKRLRHIRFRLNGAGTGVCWHPA